MTQFGSLIQNQDLDSVERELVTAAWDAASRGWSHFPVGAAIRAKNDAGKTKVFLGCNVRNDAFPAVLCAEHNAVTSAVQEAFTGITHAAVVCSNHPGGLACGICRQVLKQWAEPDAVFLSIVDRDSNVRRGPIADLLPHPSGLKQQYTALDAAEREAVDAVVASLASAYAPYSKVKRAALAVALDSNSKERQFAGVQIDNASYPASIAAEKVAIAAAVAAGHTSISKLFVAAESIDGESLQFMREFARLDAEILFIGADRAVTRHTLDALLPSSFGPENLD